MEQAFFSVPVARLEPIIKRWLREVLDETPKDLESPNKEYLTKQEAAKLLKCTPSTIDNFRRRGQIKAYSIGRNVLFKESELVELLEQAI